MSTPYDDLLVAVDLTGAGSEPTAWRAEAQPRDLLDGSATPRYALAAEAAGVDLVTLDDALEAPDDDPAALSVRLDAVALAARIGAATSRIGVVPTVTTTHTEPFHVQAQVATLDWVTTGRAGWLVDVSTTPQAAAVVGRRSVAPEDELWAEAADVVDAARALWDSWEDDAIVRDVATGRFVDRERLHYVDHVGPTFSVRGPSIVPRPPQGHPVVVARLGGEATHPLVARADVVLLTAGERLAEQVALVHRLHDGSTAVRVLVSTRIGGEPSTPADLALDDLPDALPRWWDAGADGVHLRPRVLARDLAPLLEEVLPRARPARRETTAGEGERTLRGRLGLPRPANRHARTAAATQESA